MRLKHVVSGLLFFSISVFAGSYPVGPDTAGLTPGSLCERGRSRHPQGITYCERNVSSSTKWEVIAAYNDLGEGYDINSRNRKDFKIDHFYPLCLGGSNHINNLWPQHESIFVQTDDIEHLTCEAVTQGRMRRKDALDLVIRAKTNLEEAAGILKDLRNRRGR